MVYYSVTGSGVYCRPECELLAGQNDVSMYESTGAAEAQELKPCNECKPELEVRVGNQVIDSTVSTVNASIGLNLPRHQRSCSTLGGSSQQQPSAVEAAGWRPRRASIASGHIPAATKALTDLQAEKNSHRSASRRDSHHRGGSDHARLVVEACRNIAAAAVASAYTSRDSDDSSDSSPSPRAGGVSSSSRRNSTGGKFQRKKRRGGILGFKELANKAGLSPWHFHRVFRSVTGLTPKAYGEACWQAVTTNGVSPEDQPQTATTTTNKQPQPQSQPQHVASPPLSPSAPAPPVPAAPPQEGEAQPPQPAYYLPSSKPEEILNASTILDHTPSLSTTEPAQLFNNNWLDNPSSSLMMDTEPGVTPNINPATEDMLNLTLDPNSSDLHMNQFLDQSPMQDWLGTGGLDDKDPLLFAGSEWVEPTPL
ncbi:hypothetical protein TRICI_002865 [Trichomonascus ciferrii]|uniref:HTH araC/xylS-type domain-containing protein n=1 Tax=Trichomonascus ciferrii TaxID=44093 RepID=A0A642V4R2_9ASCO|nr:hypothetical protein TRICI_002865 [Trichomonascus ciferrii]